MGKKDLDHIKIDLLSRSYLFSKLQLQEAESGIIIRNDSSLKAANRTVKHIENVVNLLYGHEKLIIEKEVIQGMKNKWYLEYFSESSYYRIRKSAYKSFFNLLNN